MNKFQVNVGGIPELQNLVLDHAEKLGYRFDRSQFVNSKEKYYQFNEFNDNMVTYSQEYYGKGETTEISLVAFLSLKEKVSISIKLGNIHALVSDEGVFISGQKISFTQFSDLSKVVTKFQNDS